MLEATMVRTLSLALALAFPLFFGAAPQSFASDRFVSVIEDLPLMDGLVENENAAVTFETAGGRIAEAEARGGVKPTVVRQFYANVLPQLGWSAQGDDAYRRESERLRLDIKPDGDGGTMVGFSVSPLGR